MSVNRFFIGPLTMPQQRRRARSRDQFRRATDIADARNIPMREALRVATEKDYSGGTWWSAGGEFP